MTQDNLKTGGKSGQRVDAAATSAHNLAELLRKAKLDAYVLHTKYTSIVCVGGYDTVDDPALRNMCPMVGILVDRSFTQGTSQFSNMPLFGVVNPVKMTLRDDVHIVAGQ